MRMKTRLFSLKPCKLNMNDLVYVNFRKISTVDYIKIIFMPVTLGPSKSSGETFKLHTRKTSQTAITFPHCT